MHDSSLKSTLNLSFQHENMNNLSCSQWQMVFSCVPHGYMDRETLALIETSVNEESLCLGVTITLWWLAFIMHF